MIESLKKWLMKHRYILIFGLLGVLLAGLAIALIFTLPATWPVVGSALAFTAGFTLAETIAIATGGIVGVGILGGVLGKVVQLIVEGTIFNAGKSLFAKLFNGFFGEKEISTPEATSTKTTTVKLGTLPTLPSKPGLLDELFKALNAIDTKKEGWPAEITVLRTKMLEGNQEIVLEEIKQKGKALREELMKELRRDMTSRSSKEIEALLEKNLMRKLRIMFHPDKSGSTDLADKIAMKIEKWWDKMKTVLKSEMRENEFDELIKRMQAEQDEYKEWLKRYSENVDKYLEKADKHIEEGKKELEAVKEKLALENERQEKELAKIRSDQDAMKKKLADLKELALKHKEEQQGQTDVEMADENQEPDPFSIRLR